MRVRFPKEDFEKWYLQERLTIPQIVKKTGVPSTTLQRWQREWGINTLERTPKTGLRFGRLLIIEEIRSGKRGNPTKCRCKCDCGKEVLVDWGNLQQKAIFSCGCFSREKRSLPYGVSMQKSVLNEYKRVARRKGNFWGLFDEEALHLFQSNCYYCGKSPSAVRKTATSNGIFLYNGIDRVDNKLGYVLSNVVPCCKQCNYVKGVLGQKEFLEHIRRIQMPVKIEYPLVSVPKDKRLAMSYLFAIYRCNARNRDLVFEISKEQCFTLFKESCAYCGIPYSNKREGFQYNGIDRIDNQIGYVWSNCIPCCRICNRMKGNQSLIDFLSLVDRIKKLPQ